MIKSATRIRFGHEVSTKRFQLLTALVLTSFVGVAHAQLNYTTSWLGNSFPGGNVAGGGSSKWVQSSILDLYVMPDGRVISNSLWDELGKEGTIFKDGDVITGFWGMHSCGGKAVSANSNYIFMGINCGSSGSGVRRYNFDGT